MLCSSGIFGHVLPMDKYFPNSARPRSFYKSENRCRHCSLFRVSFSVLSFKNYYFSPLKGSTHWCLC